MSATAAGTAAAAAAATAPVAPADAAAPVVLHPFATVSVKSHVPVVLEMKNPNYSKWASFFKSMCGKFGVKPHIDGTSLPLPTTDPLWPSWDQADCCVRRWKVMTRRLVNSGSPLKGCSAPTRSRVLSSCTMSSTPWCRATPPSRSTASARR